MATKILTCYISVTVPDRPIVCPSIFFETIHCTVPILHTFVKYVPGRKPIEFGVN